jgi:hypothetical protein
MRYRIISAWNASELVERVNAAITDGWRPSGGVAAVMFDLEDGKILIAQALVHG